MAVAWKSGLLVNYGLLVNASALGGGTNYIGISSSDEPNAQYRPKLTISYGAEIDPPVPAQNFQEDDPARAIPLNGRGAGTVQHVSGDSSLSNTLPFYGSLYDIMHVQQIYNASQVGVEGKLSSISFNRTTLFEKGRFDNLRICMAHTDLDTLTATFANNYNGYLIEVFPRQTVFLNSSNWDNWIHFELNGNFTFDSAHNLLIDIVWSGDGGNNIYLETQSLTNTRLWDATGAATGTLQARLPVARFMVEAFDDDVVDDGTNQNWWPFATNEVPEMRCQMLYNRTLLNGTGLVDMIAFQAYEAYEEWFVIENLSIRLAYSQNDTLDLNFNQHASTPWVEVLNTPSINLSYVYTGEWVPINVNDIFTYDGTANLLIDIRWRGGYGIDPGVNWGLGLSVNYSSGYWSRIANDADMNAAVATDQQDCLHNLQLIFTGSAHLTWSAVSSDVSLFTAGVVGRDLVITPQADANGAGTVQLRLTNSNGEFVTQTIPVTVNAVNDDPILDPLSDIACTEDVPYALDIDSYISDIDDPIENMTVSTDSDYATVNGTVITFVYPEGVAAETVTVTVNDGSGGSASQDLEVTVTMVNDEPWFEGFPWNVTVDATVAETVPLDPMDEESTAGQLEMSTDSQYATVSGHALQLLYPKGMGSDTVTVYLLDNTTYGTQNNVSYVLNVTIIDHPEVVENTPEGTAVPVTTNVQATFDAPMNRTKTENAFSMMLGTTEVDGTFSWDGTGTTLTFAPADHLTNGLYVVRIAASAEDESGIRMLNAFEWNFTAALGDFDGDGDGMPDQWELDNGLDPNADDADSDLDGDGLPNVYEYDSGLDPGVDDAGDDADGDGATNLEEYEEGTDPNDPDSAPSDFGWIIWVIIIVAIIAVVLLLVLLMRRKKPAHTSPEAWQEPAQGPGEPQQGEGQYPPPPPQERQPPQPGQ